MGARDPLPNFADIHNQTSKTQGFFRSSDVITGFVADHRIRVTALHIID